MIARECVHDRLLNRFVREHTLAAEKFSMMDAPTDND